MRIVIIKMAWNLAVVIVNGLGGKYLTKPNGLLARRWVETKVLARLAVWAKKTKHITADDGLLEFAQGFLKSGRIEAEMPPGTMM